MNSLPQKILVKNNNLILNLVTKNHTIYLIIILHYDEEELDTCWRIMFGNNNLLDESTVNTTFFQNNH